MNQLNQAAQELPARPAGELIGAPFGFPVVAGRAAEVELMLPGGGERVVEMRATTATLEGQRLHIAALRDVTHRKQAERDLQAALEHQNVVLAIAAHELHNPLAAISVLAHVLQDQHDTMTPAQRAQIIDQIVERTARLQLLVRRLLTASSIDAAGPRPDAGARNHRQVVRRHQRQAGRNPGHRGPLSPSSSEPSSIMANPVPVMAAASCGMPRTERRDLPARAW